MSAEPALRVEARLDPAPRAPRRLRTRLLVPTAEWPPILAGGVVSALLAAPMYVEDSPWLALGVALTVLVAWHSFRASTRIPWFPGLIAFAACIQWVVAPWMIYHFQDVAPVSPMAVESRDFFAFAVPATVALVVGMYLPLWRSGTVHGGTRATRPEVPPSFRATCEVFVAVGLIAKTLLQPFTPVSLRFVVLLVGQLGWVGAFGLFLIGAPGWKYRLAAVFAAVAFGNIVDMQFLDLLTWAVCVALLLSYKYKPRPRVVIPTIAIVAVLFMTLQAFKRGHRNDIRKLDVDRSERAAVTGATLYALLRDPSIVLSPANLVSSADRLNEGYVISRVLAWVPSAEPFAGGETIVTAIRSAAVPRFLDPDKYVVGGAELVPRFTGLVLINGTSIGLSVPGEMYANFGRGGGIAGTFFYGLLLGHVFRFFVRRARRASVWWAWAPFMLFSAFSAEQGVGEVLNQIAKAAIVMAAVVAFAPGWATLRRRARYPSAPPPVPAAP